MKRILLVILMMFFGVNIHSSGALKEVEFNDITFPISNIFVVKITGVSKVQIKELAAVAGKNQAIAEKQYYSAEIIEVINISPEISGYDEPWTVVFQKPEKEIVKKIKAGGIAELKNGDTVIIMDSEDIHYTIMYEVEGKHKIFYYYFCPDSAKSIEKDSAYIFVSEPGFSKKNGVFYGNVDYGMYPDTKEMRKRIDEIYDGIFKK